MEINGTLVVQLITTVGAWIMLHHLLFKHTIHAVAAQREHQRRRHHAIAEQRAQVARITAHAQEVWRAKTALFHDIPAPSYTPPSFSSVDRPELSPQIIADAQQLSYSIVTHGLGMPAPSSPESPL